MTALLKKPKEPSRKASAHKPLLTSEQFLDWLEPGLRADLIGGEIHMHSPVNLRHATLVNFVDYLMRSYIEEAELGGVLHRESVAIRLSSRETFLPDLSYFTAQQAARLGLTHVEFAPALVVEVLSPTTAKRDRGLKFTAYERYGVQEYWLLDPDALQHQFYVRAGDLFEEVAVDASKIESRALPGFWLKRAWLNPDKTPAVKTCVREILRTAKR